MELSELLPAILESHHRRYRVDADGRVFGIEPEPSAAQDLFHALISVGKFVRKAIHNGSHACVYETYQSMDEVDEIRPLPLAKEAVVASYAFRYFDDRFFLHPEVELFRVCCKLIGIGDRLPNLDALASGTPASSAFELADDFVRMISTKADQSYRAARSDRLKKFLARERHATQLVDELGSAHSKLMVLRLNLFYRGGEMAAITRDRAQKDFTRLLNNRRRNSGLFCDLAGYCWHFSFSVEQGFHHQLILFLSGDSTEGNGTFYSDRIGYYWNSVITKMAGAFCNYNAGHQESDLMGIGLVDITIPESRDELVKVLRYSVVYSDFVIQHRALRDKPCFGARVVLNSPPIPRNPKRQYRSPKPLPLHAALSATGVRVSEAYRGVLQFRDKANRRNK